MSEAKRFGGAHSPQNARRAEDAAAAPTKFSGKRAKRFSWRVLGLYLAPLPLVPVVAGSLLALSPLTLVWSAGSLAALWLAAWLTREGMKAADAYDARLIARPPAYPRKLFAAGLTGAAVGALSYFGAALGPVGAALFAAVAAGAHVAAFGADPMKAKGGAGIADAELDRVAAKLDQAEAVVAETVAAADAMKDRALARRVGGLARAARDILRDIQADPRDLRRARKFLSVHLVGLRDATLKFAAAAEKGVAGDHRDDYEELLTDLEQSFAAQRSTLLIDDQTALEVEIDVLRDRLRQEGALRSAE